MRQIQTLGSLALVSCVLLAACGGGGAGGATASDIPSDSQSGLQPVAASQAQLCGVDANDVCYLQVPELQRIQEDPSSFGAVFQGHKAQFLADLGPAFAGISEQGEALAFAAVVAYERKGYRAVGSPAPAPASWQLADLLAVPQLVCDEYVELALQLFDTAYPHGDGSPLQIHGVGWRRDSPVGNHAQLLVTGTGVDMLVDPDLGLVAPATLDSLLLHAAVPAAAVFAHTERGDPNMQWFKARVIDALTAGAYDPQYLIYSFVAHDPGQTDPLKLFPGVDEFTADVVRGPDNRFWYLTAAGAVWEVDRSGLKRAYDGGAAQIAAGLAGDAVYVRMADGSVSAFDAGGQWAPVGNGIASIASGAGDRLLLLGASGDVWSAGPSGWSAVGAGVTAMATGRDGAGVYALDAGGTLQVANASGSFDAGRAGIAAIVGERSGHGVYVRTLAGDLYRVDASGTWDLLQRGVRDVVPGIGGLTLNVLLFDGTVWQGDLRFGSGDWNTGTFAWTQLWAGDFFAGIASPDAGMTIEGRRVGGAVASAAASTF